MKTAACGVSRVLGYLPGLLLYGGFGPSFDCKSGLNKFMVGIEGCGGVGGDI